MKQYFKQLVYLIVGVFIFSPCIVSGKLMKNNEKIEDLLVFDHDAALPVPKKFRVDVALKASASGQFSEQNFLKVLPEMSGEIWVIDLRQESHGFISGIPISWYGPKNQSNIGLSIEKIKTNELKLLSQLTQQEKVVVHQIVEKKSGNIQATLAKEIPVKRVESESQLVSLQKLHYFRIPILDHHRPDDAAVESFIRFVKTLPSNAWLHFHCRGGQGRSTTFMVMYDILHHAKTQPLDLIVKRQATLGGSDLFKEITDEDSLWKKEAAMARKDFIITFYEYARDPSGYPKVTLQEWIT